ncbi:hypothetical protein LOC71_10390 [Rhodopirellula sp. JC740]|uniref:Uncharacterized protein n=1 Tax=Rhodopirellula halodulae TaxID=2894198 RepID=A0ABS8NGM3_9BACT|nr:hypothetical protein [Rhodopirellula sp. JC740]MCC9642685.1 hypothetical protein [Rhodopirellula sp. JC740]
MSLAPLDKGARQLAERRNLQRNALATSSFVARAFFDMHKRRHFACGRIKVTTATFPIATQDSAKVSLKKKKRLFFFRNLVR